MLEQAHATEVNSYADDDYLRPYRRFLPDVMRLPRDPQEEWWTWQDSKVHLDRLDVDHAPLKVLVLHGGGGNGRLLSAFGALVHGLGYSYVAPDLPGFGLTQPGPSCDLQYRSWVNLATDLIAHEQARDGLPVVTFGGSLGGMLAYNVAAASGEGARCDCHYPGGPAQRGRPRRAGSQQAVESTRPQADGSATESHWPFQRPGARDFRHGLDDQ